MACFSRSRGLSIRPIEGLQYFDTCPIQPAAIEGRAETFYRRLYHFDEQEQHIRSTYPQYLAYDPVFQTTLQSVPESMVQKIYDPRQRFRELEQACTRAEIEEDAVAFLSLLQNKAQVPSSALGITGSLLTGLFTEKSDLDVVVFGTENCRSVYRALLRMLDERSCPDLSRLDSAGMQELFEQRVADTRMDYEEFVKLEKRKANQGRFRQRAYFVRFVRSAHEAGHAYGSLRYAPIGRAVITASIADDQDAIFTPCRYPISQRSPPGRSAAAQFQTKSSLFAAGFVNRRVQGN